MAAINPKALRELMELGGITPRDLADRLELSHDYVLNILNGHRRVKRNPVLRRRIAEAVGCRLEWIETHDDEAA